MSDFSILPPKLRGMLLKLGDDVTVEQARCSLMYIYALKGESWANHEIHERTEGKVATTVKLDFNPEEVEAELNQLFTDEPSPDNGGAAHVDDQHPGQ